MNSLDVNQPTSQNQLKKELLGYQRQIKYFEEVTKNALQGNQVDWNHRLGEIKGKISELIEQFPAKKKNTNLPDLQQLKQTCTEYETKRNDLKFESHDILDQLNQLSAPFKEDTKLAAGLFVELGEKLERLKETIDHRNQIKEKDENKINAAAEKITSALERFVFSVKRILPGLAILNELGLSLKKDDKLEEKYTQLKTAWFEAFVLYRKTEHGFNKAFFETVFPKIAEFKQGLQKVSLSFDLLKTCLEGISVSNIKNSSIKTTLINNYKEQLKTFIEAYKAMDKVKESIQFFNRIKIVLFEIENLTNKNNEHNEAELKFLEEGQKNEIIKQKENIGKNYTESKKIIIDNWNEFYMEFIKLTHRIDMFSLFKHITEKMSTCCLFIDQIKNNEDKQYDKTFDFNNLEKLVQNTNKEISDAQIELLEIKDIESLLTRSSILSPSKKFEEASAQQQILSSFDLFSKKIKPNHDLEKEYVEIQEIQPKTMLCDSKVSLEKENIPETALLLSYSDEHKNDMATAFDLQFKELTKELEKYQNDTHTTLMEILPQICDESVKLLNQKHNDLLNPEPNPTPKKASWWGSQPEEKPTPKEFKSPFDAFKEKNKSDPSKK
jgi:hypothetical protein